jgi:hypothetical protein
MDKCRPPLPAPVDERDAELVGSGRGGVVYQKSPHYSIIISSFK